MKGQRGKQRAGVGTARQRAGRRPMGRGAAGKGRGVAALPSLPTSPPSPHVVGLCAPPPLSVSLSLPMAAWLGFRAEEDEAEDEACFWRYDSTWEEEEEEDGGSDDDDDEGEPEGAEAAAGEEPEEQPVPSWVQGCRQAQVGAGAGGTEQSLRGGTGVGGSPFPASPELLSRLRARRPSPQFSGGCRSGLGWLGR